MTRTELKLRRTAPNAWVLTDAVTGADVGGIEYVHDADGNHYRAWVLVDGARQHVGAPLAQLDMAARIVADALSKALERLKAVRTDNGEGPPPSAPEALIPLHSLPFFLCHW